MEPAHANLVVKSLADIWARNAVGKYKIALQAREDAANIDGSLHPALLSTKRLLLRTAEELERI